MTSCGLVYLLNQLSIENGVSEKEKDPIVGNWTVIEKDGCDRYVYPNSYLVFNNSDTGYWHIPFWILGCSDINFKWYKINETTVLFNFTDYGNISSYYELKNDNLFLELNGYSIKCVRGRE